MPLPTPTLEHVGGTLTGPQLQGRILPGGADFQTGVSDTSAALQWLTESMLVGSGARFPDRVEISLLRLL